MRRSLFRLAALGWLALVVTLSTGCAAFGPKTAGADGWQAHYDAGRAAYDKGDYGKAQQMFAAAVGEAESFGDSDPRLARSLNNLAATYAAQRKYANAEPLYQRALGLFEKVRGPNHSDVATCLENYAALLRQTNRDAEAEQLEQRAHAIRQQGS